jgi:SAM-dependent MidA family methyltransferase
MSEAAPLEAEIRTLIRAAGPMPVWRYMQLCLMHPRYGYYIARDPLGRAGDFITAPEVSQMFGELIGLWAASVWRMMEEPAEINLIELGPGHGTMMADALRAIRVLPAFRSANTVHMVEVNPVLRHRQVNALADAGEVFWHERIDDVPDGPSIILANEYFDVLPVHQMMRQGDGWHERVIEIDTDGNLAFGVAPKPSPRFETLLPPQVAAAPEGAIFEWRPDSEIMRIAARVRDFGGAALIIDYGHARSDAGDTFQAVAQHAYADPLKNPGQADITAHVDFEALKRATEAAGARSHGPVEQGAFLRQLGIEARAQALMTKATPAAAQDIAVALQRLTSSGRGGMGSMFKVLGVSHPTLPMLVGLSADHHGATP